MTLRTKLQLFSVFIAGYLVAWGARAQVNVRDSTVRFWQAALVGQGFQPMGHWSARYPFLGCIGVEAGYKFRSGVSLATGAGYLLSESARYPELLNQLALTRSFTDAQGNTQTFQGIIDGNGELTNLGIAMQGIMVPLRIGYTINALRFGGSNPNCGVLVQASGLWTRHWLRFQVQSDKLPMLTGDYARGYDRLTEGLGGSLALGYRHYGNSRGFNISVLAEAGLLTSRNLRRFDYATRTADTAPHLDAFVGFRIEWILPLYKTLSSTYYY
jgi:hypothetical protein